MDRPLSSILVVALLVVVVGSISPTHDPPSPTGHPVRPGTGPSPGPGPSNSGLPAAPARSTPLDLGSAHPGVVHPAITSALTVIYPNGTISNLSAPINVSGNTYAITANFTGGLEIERNHTFLRGNDWTLTTDLSLSVGVIVDNASGVTVRSLTVEGGTTAFLVVNSAYIHLQSDRAVGSTGWAVQVASSGNVSVTGCSSDSGEGFYA
ncbi:MAG TPA: hypothetical protein VMH90_03520, partial [Thermoplasmata archaeon]|nr:hypothetical protein [Thermoplasmata archaeon]